MSNLRKISVTLLGAFFVLAGLNHFLNPSVYVGMIPNYLPYPEALNFISGAAEVVGGLGVFIPRLRWLAGWGLIALLVAIFPANIDMALNGTEVFDVPRWILWARLPLQAVFIAWVYQACLRHHGMKGE